MHRRERPDSGKVFHRDVPGEGCSVHKQSIAPHLAIVSDVRVCQDEIVVADLGPAAAFLRSPVHSYIFTKNISIPHNQLGGLAAKRIVLRITTNQTKRMKNVVPPDVRGALDNCMRMQHATIA
jgi:hypothetical protein